MVRVRDGEVAVIKMEGKRSKLRGTRTTEFTKAIAFWFPCISIVYEPVLCQVKGPQRSTLSRLSDKRGHDGPETDHLSDRFEHVDELFLWRFHSQTLSNSTIPDRGTYLTHVVGNIAHCSPRKINNSGQLGRENRITCQRRLCSCWVDDRRDNSWKVEVQRRVTRQDR